ncbi:hypothetical protein KUV75_11235 [Qipengyuania gaetbuli]|uniref:Alpha-carbonic anhydrase domain-containing protein n=1 Tax=Qipengyuania gaetbuli TaxID=266952 RepID=A0A844Y466_9SPHN|nr:hypothetical protein [Qipengyuania gaetbuli]MBY6015470.1 hypothetical protein [Qipengyuania gaetbuli]MXO52103.1 hypothetical protein [Qipengyuania gaetbuli]
METSLFTTQRKKLVMIGLFLLAVMAMVGREEDPGMLQSLADQSAEATARPVVAAPAAAPAQAQVQPRQQASPELDSWYSEAGSLDAPAETTPEDQSWLVNDTEPLVSTDPIAAQ